jgi:hypothetical protein
MNEHAPARNAASEVTMLRIASASLVFALAFMLAPLPTFAQTADASPAEQLRRLDHQALEVGSGLAAVRRELLALGVRGNDTIGAAQLSLRFVDHFVALSPVSATFSLDGQRLFTSADAHQIELGEIYTGAVPSGPHVLSVDLRYRGEVLYTTGYQFHFTSSYSFDAPLDRTTHIEVIGHDRDMFAAPDQRYGLEYSLTSDPTE